MTNLPLQELIQKVGPLLFTLRYVGDKDTGGTWVATKSLWNGEVETRYEANGVNPEESVANLWLVLNKK